jgi:tetratricopeptide (TPR) repeat protein
MLVVAWLTTQVGVSAQDRVDAPTLASARNALQPIPLPSLEALESPVILQIEQAVSAVRTLESARDADRRELADAYGRLGQVFHAYEFFDAAAACYENARQLAPRDYRWPHLLGAVHEQTGGFEPAIDAYQAALRLEPDDHASRLRLGHVYLQQDRRGEARTQFDASRERFPASSMAGLAEIALRERRFEDAIGLLEDVLRRAPHATSLHYSIGMAYRGLGRMEDARAHLDRLGQGRVRGADPLVDALPNLLTGSRALINQGRIELEAGAYEAAAAMFGRAVAAAPGSLDARTGLAAALERLGDAGAALAELAEAARRLPDSAGAQRQFGRALLVNGRADAALGVLQRALDLDAADEDSLLDLTILLSDRQRFADAIERLDAAYRRFPDRDRTATTLARMLAASPDAVLRNGARALEMAMMVHGRNPTAVHGETVALALAELGRCGDAMEWLTRSIAQAEREGDAAEAGRLRTEAQRYQRDPCR